jgi:hypothetical protein
MITGFDITQSAQIYAEVSGLLTGFGITILILFIESTLGPRRDQETDAWAAQVAFSVVAYVILTTGAGAILWGFIAGLSTPDTLRTWSLVLLAGANSTLSVVMLVQALFLVVPRVGPMAFISDVERYFETLVVSINALGLFFFNVVLFGLLRGETSLLEVVRTQPALLALVAFILFGLTLIVGFVKRGSGLATTKSFAAFYVLLLVWVGVLSLIFGGIGVLGLSGLAVGGVIAVDATWAVLTGLAMRFMQSQ